MKNLIKNLIIVCLLVIATIMVVPNVLAEFGDANNTLTVNGLEAGQNVNVNLYRIMTVNIENNQPKAPVYSWVPSVATWLKNNGYKDFVVENTNVVNQGKNGFNTSTNTTTLAEMYGKLAKAIRDSIKAETFDSTFAGVTKVGPKNSNGATSVEFTDLELGNYFILADNGMKVYSPTSVRIVPVWNDKTDSWDVVDKTTTLKSSEPGITKEVSGDGSVKVGDVLTYTLNIDVPTYPDGTTNKTLYVADTLSEGLTFLNDSEHPITVKAGNSTLTSGTHYNVETTPSGNYGGSLKIDFSGNYYDAIKAAKYSEITVTYYVKVNEKAEVKDGNNVTTVNTADLHFNHDPYGDEDHKTSGTVTVYTYGLDITKVDADTKAKLNGAEFKISTDAAGKNILTFTKVSDGVYKYDPNGTVTTKLAVASDGTLKVTGLDLGTYYITETKAPSEYIIKAGALQLKIEDSNNDGIEDNNTTGYLASDFENSKSLIELPVTGGIGTLIFSIVGILFMGISIVLIKNILKKKEVQL